MRVAWVTQSPSGYCLLSTYYTHCIMTYTEWQNRHGLCSQGIYCIVEEREQASNSYNWW